MKFCCSLLLLLAAGLLPAPAAEPLYTIPLRTIDGVPATLQPYAGKVLLVVNTASQCGYTGQYAGLEALYQKFRSRGLAVLGFPCNDFGGQEPGTEAEIRGFCTSQYQVSFPMFSKLHVTGPEQHPLYAFLSGRNSPRPGAPEWNFGKILVARDGRILARYDSDTEPNSTELAAAIEQALGR